MRSGDFSKLRAPKSRLQNQSASSRRGRPRGAGTGEREGSAERARCSRRPAARRSCDRSRMHRLLPGDCDIDQRLRDTGDIYLPGLAAFPSRERGRKELPRTRAGACGGRGLVRAGWGRRGTPLRSLPSRGRGLHEKVGGGTKFSLPEVKAILRTEPVARVGGPPPPPTARQLRHNDVSFHLSPSRPRHAGSRGPARGTCAQPSPVTPITPTAHPRPAPARGWGRPLSGADRLALTLTSRSCGRRPILGLARSPSRTPGSLGHPRGAGRRVRAGAARAGRPGSRVAARRRGARLRTPRSRSPAWSRGLPLSPARAGPAAACHLGPTRSRPASPPPSARSAQLPASAPRPLAWRPLPSLPPPASPLPFGPSSAPRPSARSPSPPLCPPLRVLLPAPSPRQPRLPEPRFAAAGGTRWPRWRPLQPGMVGGCGDDGGGRGGSLPPPAWLEVGPGESRECGGLAELRWIYERVGNRAARNKQRRRGNRVKLGTASGQFPPCSQLARRSPPPPLQQGEGAASDPQHLWHPHARGAQRRGSSVGRILFIHSFVCSSVHLFHKLRACSVGPGKGLNRGTRRGRGDGGALQD